MKGITLCADCAYYNMKKHKCTRGCKIDPDVSKGENPSFYVDCPLPDVEPVQKWIPCSERLPDMRTRVFVVAVRNREHYPKDTEPSRMFIAMRIEMLSDDNWYWASATDIYGYDGIGGMIVLGGWEVVAWTPMPDAYEPPEKE